MLSIQQLGIVIDTFNVKMEYLAVAHKVTKDQFLYSYLQFGFFVTGCISVKDQLLLRSSQSALPGSNPNQHF